MILDDRLVFLYMGTSGVAPSGHRGMYTGGAIGLASLRRDGFASMDGGGQLTTRLVSFDGQHCFINFRGETRVELLDRNNRVLASSHAITGDNTRHRIVWQDRRDLSEFEGQPIRFRFHQSQHSSLFAFWVTPDPDGASQGYLAAGGPDYSGMRDLPGSEETDINP